MSPAVGMEGARVSDVSFFALVPGKIVCCDSTVLQAVLEGWHDDSAVSGGGCGVQTVFVCSRSFDHFSLKFQTLVDRG